jgi:hypothetical protein
MLRGKNFCLLVRPGWSHLAINSSLIFWHISFLLHPSDFYPHHSLFHFPLCCAVCLLSVISFPDLILPVFLAIEGPPQTLPPLSCFLWPPVVIIPVCLISPLCHLRSQSVTVTIISNGRLFMDGNGYVDFFQLSTLKMLKWCLLIQPWIESQTFFLKSSL